MANYLTEAFKELRLVEQDFDISADKDKIDELTAFVGDDIEIDEEPVYDVNATDESELADNYIGKVILECECCHSRIYKDAEDVVVDDSGVANIDEQCPLCKNELGFTVIGKIDEFSPKEESEDELDIEDSDVEKTSDELEDEKAFPDDDVDDKDLDESLNESKYGLDLKEVLDDVITYFITMGWYPVPKDEMFGVESWEELLDSLNLGLIDIVETADGILDYLRPSIEFANKHPSVAEDDPSSEDEREFFEKISKAKNDYIEKYSKDIKEGVDRKFSLDERIRRKHLTEPRYEEPLSESVEYVRWVQLPDGKWKMWGSNPGPELDPNFLDRARKQNNIDYKDARVSKNGEYPEGVDETDIYDKHKFIQNEDVDPADGMKDKVGTKDSDSVNTGKPEEDDGDESIEDPWGQKIEDAEQEELTEEVNIKATDEYSVEVDKDDLGNLSINVSNDNKETTDSDVEEIVPLTQEEEEDIKNNDPEEDSLDDQLDQSEENDQVESENDKNGLVETEPEEVEESEDDDDDEDDEDDEDKEEDEDDEDDEVKEESLDINDFNEDSFNKLCEGFMKRVYSNVDSFKTEKVSDLKNSLVVEGIITFKEDENGRKNKARTNFNFTECYVHGKKVLFSGENKTFSKNKHPFKIKGSVEGREFLPESFHYNYNVKQLNESNTQETVTISGKVILK